MEIIKHAQCLLFFVTFFGFVYANGSLELSLHNFTQTLQQLEKTLKDIKVIKIDDNTYKIGEKTINLVTGDMTQQKNIDVLVNAANTGITTVGGSGTAGAIGGKMKKDEKSLFAQDIKDRYKKENGEIGGAYIGTLKENSTLNKLGYKYLVNAVGPDCRAGQDVNLVANAYRNSLQEAAKLNLNSILFPRISSLAFGCPAAIINKHAVDTVVNYFIDNPTSSISEVYFIFYSEADQEALKEYRVLLR